MVESDISICVGISFQEVDFCLENVASYLERAGHTLTPDIPEHTVT